MNTTLKHVIRLTRLNRPIGIYLLLWPTLWALWLASNGHPPMKIVAIFVLGVIVMRSAGCIINDIADRHFDGFVARTRERPIASGKLSVKSALILFVILLAVAFFLVCQLNFLTIELAFIAALIAIIYPFLKRFTYLPQAGLGLAFAFSVPMAFAAVQNTVPLNAWLVFSAAALWPFIYDTIYAMADREDDLKINVKSTAILFGEYDKGIIFILQLIFIGLVIAIGHVFQLDKLFFQCVTPVFFLFAYQQWLIKNRDPNRCIKAFLNNNWVGLIIFAGILL